MTTNEKSTTRIECTKEGPVATLRFVTDEGVAIFSSRVLGELGQHIDKIAEDGSLRFVVFRGQGNVFLAGADIQQMSHFTEDQAEGFSRAGHRVMNTISALPQVTFAALNGHAMGGGCELALACDFRIIARGARIGVPESTLGLIPGWGGTIRLPKLIGDVPARRLLFSGRCIKAEEALDVGLVDEVVPTNEDLDAALEHWYELLATGSPSAIARIKKAIFNNDEMKQFGMCFSCSDAKEGVSAFLEKRKPLWTTWKDCGKT
ncbi:MAG: enoyl-CoA hydratase/isomerase family protein [Phycisphaerae bacterium]|nr:enoyl-CoA hydratase/isomerase family protein [Phycisphaerae bacterium]